LEGEGSTSTKKKRRGEREETKRFDNFVLSQAKAGRSFGRGVWVLGRSRKEALAGMPIAGPKGMEQLKEGTI